MIVLLIMGLVLAVGVGVYVGLGMPGTSGREDRVVSPGKARREAQHRPLDWFRPFRR